ncbi:MAG: ribosome-binding factor A [Candidatus Zambryskibacteria bacterium]|nr:ribosome-binding factor A [Candidatus Zambryskibacteria bacterium]
MSTRNEKIAEILHDLGARFLSLNGNKSSLITVTRVNLTRDGKYATIFFTVFPDNFEKTALEFAKRKRSEFKKFIKENSRLGRIPQMDFEIDSGEKNRQKIDNLLNQG